MAATLRQGQPKLAAKVEATKAQTAGRELPASPNFSFLKAHNPLLVRYAAQAEVFVFEDANLALIRLRQFAELLAQHAAASVGVPTTDQDDFVAILNRLRDHRVGNAETFALFHGLRKSGNAAVHGHSGTKSEALHQLRMARTLAVWFHRAFGNDKQFKPGPFVPPPDPVAADKSLQEELERLREQIAEQRRQSEQATQSAAQEAESRKKAEQDAKRAYDDLAAAMALASESEATLAAERASFQQQLIALQASAASAPQETVEATIAVAQQAATLLDLDEAATRHQIDQQLRDAGWEVDSQLITFSKGVRPQKGKNLAIAEWPTASGPADYVLFNGLTPIASVEAKKAIKDIPGSLEQAKRYSRDFKKTAEMTAVGPWAEYKLPFTFATNGRPFLQQIRTKSGIWFLDARQPTNLSRPLEGWYSPEGLEDLLKQDLPAADQSLRDESPDYLPLRDYQKAAVGAVEQGLVAGKREMLVAMATGTGKTITCIGLIYRLIKAQRFRRILFLVDRTALGEQTANALKDVKLDNFQSFTDIYDVKELGDIVPDSDTKLHVATVQGMVKRLLFPSEATPPLPVDLYDCVIIDECHRGYSLDRDMSDAELEFRDEQDYISKYRRVLDHFDAVKIGLTATPALHTAQIFGAPIYSYTYRQAVIDGWLVDHEPPIRIETALAQDGIHWKRGETIQTYLPFTGQIDPVVTADEVDVEIEEFNKRVITEPFNSVICAELAKHIDPSLPGKTIVFAATDNHADMVVDLLKQAFKAQYGSVEESAVVKITATADKPNKLIRRFKNERLPVVAVTVDLLTTGIDVPAVSNLVFLRRVRSRILYEQMLGRGTRLCADLNGPGQDKEVFRVFDAVDLYSALQPYSAMQPVVVQPAITFTQLAEELATVTDPVALTEIHGQLLAKFQRKKRVIVKDNATNFQTAAGVDVQTFSRQASHWTPTQLKDWLKQHPSVPALLDRIAGLEPNRLLISDHPDEVRKVERGYGTATKPEDYLESFKAFVSSNLNALPALLVVTQRPRDLTRQQLKELKLALDDAGFSETSLQTAYRESTNQDIAATIIGYVRHVANGLPLMPYRERVVKAMSKILRSQAWTVPQRKWLERIGKQLEVETIVDHDAFEHGQFKAEGGFSRLNKVFDGKLDEILKNIAEEVWQAAA